MTRGQQILAQLLTADVEAGKVTVRGAELFLAGQRVEPLLTYETVTPQASSPVRLSQQSGGPKNQVDNINLVPGPVVEDKPMTTTFAALPKDILVRYAQREELLQDRERAAHRASAWQGNFAALPEDPLMAVTDIGKSAERSERTRSVCRLCTVAAGPAGVGRTND